MNREHVCESQSIKPTSERSEQESQPLLFTSQRHAVLRGDDPLHSCVFYLFLFSSNHTWDGLCQRAASKLWKSKARIWIRESSTSTGQSFIASEGSEQTTSSSSTNQTRRSKAQSPSGKMFVVLKKKKKKNKHFQRRVFCNTNRRRLSRPIFRIAPPSHLVSHGPLKILCGFWLSDALPVTCRHVKSERRVPDPLSHHKVSHWK